MALYQEPSTICLSVSKKNQRKKDIAETYSAIWGESLSASIWRIIDEYDQMQKWAIYNRSNK